MNEKSYEPIYSSPDIGGRARVGKLSRSYIILVNWNGRADTLECLASLFRLQGEDFRVVIVDNGSTDGSLDAIDAWTRGNMAVAPDGPIWSRIAPFPMAAPSLKSLSRHEAASAAPDDATLYVIAAGENLGFAAANNLGLAFAARDSEADFFWILNNDTVVEPGALAAFAALARSNPHLGTIGGVLLYYDAPTIIQGLGGWLDPRRALSGHIGSGASIEQLPDRAAVEAQLAYVMGASMFVTRAAYAAVGDMSEDYFLYYEELDWAARLPPSYRLGICHDAVIYHKEGKSIGTSSFNRPSDTSLYYSYASAMRFYGRHKRRYAPLAVARILYNLIGFAQKRDGAAFAVTFRAIADVMTGRRRRGRWGSEEFLVK